MSDSDEYSIIEARKNAIYETVQRVRKLLASAPDFQTEEANELYTEVSNCLDEIESENDLV